MADTSLYNRLKKLFATGTIVRNVGGKKLKIADTDNIQSFINRRGVDRYHRVYSSGTGGYGSAHGRGEAAAAFQGSRLQLFRDYDMMDNDPIIASVLDIYADESTVKDEFGQILSIKSKNSQVQDILHNLFYDILNVEFNLWPWVRNMAKYGDFFLYLDLDQEYGVVNAIPLSVYETIRIEGENPDQPFSVRFKIENDFLHIGKTDFENFEVGHFRLLSDTNFLPYGKAMIENGRRVWKQLQLMEDAMLIHRIMRAPDKRKIMVDIGNIPPAEIDTFMNRIMDRMKKTPLVDPKTGDYNLRYNMMNITEDFYLPVRGKDSGTDISNLPGLQFNAIEDIEYLRKKLMAAFKVPKSFIGYDEDVSGKATLAAQDVRFARTIERIQRIMVSELTKIAIIHLYIQGFRDEELIDFELSLTSPSIVYEQEKLNMWKEKMQVATDMMGTKLISQDWIYHHIFEMSEQDIETQRDKVKEDVKRMAELTKIEQEESQPAQEPGAEEQPAPEGEPGGEPVPLEGEPDAAEQQVDDVDAILSSLNEPTAEDESELEEAKMGRPKKGMAYGQDSHPRGRDPLGHKENMGALTVTPQRKDKKKSPLALEEMDKWLLAKRGRRNSNMIIDNTAPKGSLLDESNILDLEN
jgi:hypothetical protein